MTSRLRWAISLLAIAGTLPYLVLKVAWLSGSRVGLLDPEFGDSPVMHAANAITLCLDLAAIVLALAFVMSWGRRVAASWVLFPMWVGTGLLAPIVLLVPVQMLLAAGSSGEQEAPQDQAIAGWVFTMVYSGFIWLGFFLLLGFVLYARDRWGAAWREPMTARAPAGAAAAVLVALGVAAALETTRLEDMSAVAFAGDFLFYAAAAAAVWLCARPTRVARGVTILLGWVGSGAIATWGCYGAVLLLVPNDLVGDAPLEALDAVAQLVRTLAGVATAVLVARTLRLERRTGPDATGEELPVRAGEPDYSRGRR